MAGQFALGGLWSAFLVFYTRGAVLAASWPFLLVLAAIFIGNELFKKYHSQLVFTAVLYFFALFSYAIVTVPIFTAWHRHVQLFISRHHRAVGIRDFVRSSKR